MRCAFRSLVTEHGLLFYTGVAVGTWHLDYPVTKLVTLDKSPYVSEHHFLIDEMGGTLTPLSEGGCDE